MVEGYVIEYHRTVFFIGRPNRGIPAPTKAVYVPSEQILVQFSQMSGMNTELDAQNSYQQLLAELGRSENPKPVELPEGFVNWARSVHQARNPSKDISDFIFK